MSWKSFFRALEADQARRQREQTSWERRWMREFARSAKEAARVQKRLEKQAKLAAAYSEAAQYEQYIDTLLSLHTDCIDTWNWAQTAGMGAPQPPVRSYERQVAAQVNYDAYSPGFFDRLLGGTDSTRHALQQAVFAAEAADRAAYDQAFQIYEYHRRRWDFEQGLARHVPLLHLESCRLALDHAEAFSAIKMLGTEVTLARIDGDAATLTVVIRDEDIVPKEEVKLLQSGRTSTKQLSASKYWGLYQDHVCSCALRVALDTFAVVPVRRCIANVCTHAIDRSSGHMTYTTIFAIHAAREDLAKLNLDEIDPSDAMKHFPHRMSFKKTTGFSEVSPITHDDHWASS